MRKFFTRVVAFCCLLLSFPAKGFSQCGSGYTQSQLNWDFLDYLVTSGSYSGFVTTTMASNQYFMMGTTRVGILAAMPAFTLGGENATHTGDLAGYTGQDVQFTPTVNGDSLVISFDQPVTNARFAIYDIDNLASFQITARDDQGNALNPTVTRQGSTILTLGGVPSAVTVGTTSTTNLGNTSNQGTAIISVTGPVSVIKVTILNRGGNPVFWISDINACVSGSFPNNWRNISRPFTGMPAYILTVEDNNFLMLNPDNGQAKPLFTDPGWTNINGMAYDPVHRVLYYTYSLTASSVNNKTIWKYDVDSETIGTLVANVTTSLGIPTYDQGVESGSASFYDGYYYFGVESSNGSRNSGRENTVWRIEFDAAQNPIRASQVYATRSDSSISGNNTLIHDWSDIGVSNNAMMYDFDGAASDPEYYHFNLMTGQRTQYAPTGGGNNHPRQLAIDWAENVYNQGNTTNSPPSAGFIVPYNYNGTVNMSQNFTITVNGSIPSGSWGDCSEAFRPLCDFGDAPASYDPDPWSPAAHEMDTALRIGNTFDREWNKISSDSSDADGNDEDGLSFVPIYSPTSAQYLAEIDVYNNTGEDATVIAWLDFNGNGLFDPSETCMNIPPIPSAPNLQSVYLFWPSAPSGLPIGSVTYLRIRITKAIHGMSDFNATGYYPDGETEDYQVYVNNYPLAVKPFSFNARMITGNKAKLDWVFQGDEIIHQFEIQRSNDNLNWDVLGTMDAILHQPAYMYSYLDEQPHFGRSFYRIRLLSHDGTYRYSEIKSILYKNSIKEMKIWPNPAIDHANISLESVSEARAELRITNMIGHTVFQETMILRKGTNQVDLPLVGKLLPGTYLVQARVEDALTVKKLIIHKN